MSDEPTFAPIPPNEPRPDDYSNEATMPPPTQEEIARLLANLPGLAMGGYTGGKLVGPVIGRNERGEIEHEWIDED